MQLRGAFVFDELAQQEEAAIQTVSLLGRQYIPEELYVMENVDLFISERGVRDSLDVN